MPGQGNHEEKCRVPGAQGCKANIPCSGLPEQGISGKRCLVKVKFDRHEVNS